MAIGNLINAFSGAKWFLGIEYLNNFAKVLSTKHFDLSPQKSNETIVQTDQFYQEFANTAVFNLNGTLMQTASYLDAMCGFISYDQISQKLDSCKKDNILFLINSPGGQASGCKLLADQIYSMRNSKQLISFNRGLMCSAAQYIGAACDLSYSETELNTQGSIGCVACHIDQSKYDAKEGFSYTYIASGKYKTLGNSHEPLSQEGLSFIQDEVNESAKVFISDVAKFRGLSSTKEIEEAQCLTGEVALSIGLIDGILSYRNFIKQNNL